MYLRSLTISKLSFIAAFILAACNDGKFSQSAGGGPQPEATQAPVEPTIVSAAPTPTPGCTTAGTTVVKLLTASVTNKAANQIIKYQLSMNDCQGVETPIKATEIKFDVNAVMVVASTSGSPSGTALPYTVQSPEGQTLSSGSLEIVQGEDLFGNASPSYWHYKTNNPINITGGIKQVILSVDISNSENHLPSNTGGTGTYPATEVIETFLRFGDAEAVKQPVTFNNI